MNPKDKHADWLLKPTANELADALFTVENYYTEPQDEVLISHAATMLRQQQAEIEALKQIIDANNLNQNIGQFVKPTNKPVAWMDYLEHSDVYDLNVSGRGIPLYTHEYERPHNTVLVPCDKLAEMQAEIDDLKAKLQLHEAMDNQCASLMQQFRKASEI